MKPIKTPDDEDDNVAQQLDKLSRFLDDDEGSLKRAMALLTAKIYFSPRAISIDEFCKLTSLGRTTTFKFIRDGRLRTRKLNRRTLILMSSVDALLGLGQVNG